MPVAFASGNLVEDFEMSDEAGSAPVTPNEAQDGATSLYNAAGERIHSSGRQVQKQTDQLAEFVQQQPLTAALVALVIGYLLGKVT